MCPWDIQIWEAKEPPKWLKKLETNALICSKKGKGANGICNADYDGDLFGFANDQRFLRLAEALPEGSGAQVFADVETRVKKSLSKVPVELLPSVASCRQYMLQVDSMPVKGIVYAMAERVFQHVFYNSPDPRQDGRLLAAIEMGAYGRAAMNVPKWHLATKVTSKARACMKRTGACGRGKKNLQGLGHFEETGAVQRHRIRPRGCTAKRDGLTNAFPWESVDARCQNPAFRRSRQSVSRAVFWVDQGQRASRTKWSDSRCQSLYP